jgi:hypothetical protein
MALSKGYPFSFKKKKNGFPGPTRLSVRTDAGAQAPHSSFPKLAEALEVLSLLLPPRLNLAFRLVTERK